jgi:hypothetical protein
MSIYAAPLIVALAIGCVCEALEEAHERRDWKRRNG